MLLVQAHGAEAHPLVEKTLSLLMLIVTEEPRKSITWKSIVKNRKSIF